MSVWVVEAEIALLLFAIALPIAIGPMVYLHYRRYGGFHAWPALLSLGALLYFWGLVAFTLFPLPAADERFCTLREEVSFWQLSPLATVGAVGDVVNEAGLLGALTSPEFLQVAFNVLLLVPLGAYLAFRYRMRLGFTALLGLGVSLLIELTQGTGVWGLYGCPYRLADVDDLAANTVGAIVGWMIGAALVGVLPDPNPPATNDMAQPTVGRRVSAFLLDVMYFGLFGALIQTSYLIVSGGNPDGPNDAVVAIASVSSGLLLTLVVPLVRADRATPGQISTWLAVARNETAAQATRASVAVRWAVRWGPLLTIGILQPLIALAVVSAAELITGATRRDRRTLSAVVSRTHTVTRRLLSLGDD